MCACFGGFVGYLFGVVLTAIEVAQQRQAAADALRFRFAGQRLERIEHGVVDQFGGALQAAIGRVGDCGHRALEEMLWCECVEAARTCVMFSVIALCVASGPTFLLFECWVRSVAAHSDKQIC